MCVPCLAPKLVHPLPRSSHWQWGLMVGSVFELVLTDLWREGWEEEAKELQLAVEKRMRIWCGPSPSSLKPPFPPPYPLDVSSVTPPFRRLHTHRP